jgi:hypothetical protein
MAINPLITNSTQLSAIAENITRLLARLPQSIEIPATLKVSESSTLLKINANTLETSSAKQNNGPQTATNQITAKPILVQLPQINLPTLRNLNTELPIIVTILQKKPLLKLQLSLLKTTADLPSQRQILASPESINQGATKPLAELTVSANFKAQLKLLVTQDIPLKQLQQIIKLSKAVSSNTTTKSIQSAVKPATASPVLPANMIASSVNIKPSQPTTTSALIWPQHAALEKLSQTLIVSKLLQLNQQLPTNIKDPFVKVFQGWIRQLARSSSNDKFLEQYIKNPNQTANKQLSALMKQQAPNWEASIRKQLTQKNSNNNLLQSSAISKNNIKAQLLKIIQSLPVILARLDPISAAKIGIPETEIWQMVFKIRQLINQQLQTVIPSSGNLNQPELAMNFLEQNLRLLILWLKNVEQQQSEQHSRQTPTQQNPQSTSTPANHLRFELPMPSSNQSQMIEVEIEQHKKNKSKQKNIWKWKLKIQFNFGAEKRLITKTQVNSKQALIQFEGDPHYEDLITTVSMSKLASSLEQKTGLSCKVEFDVLDSQKNKKPPQFFNLKA